MFDLFLDHFRKGTRPAYRPAKVKHVESLALHNFLAPTTEEVTFDYTKGLREWGYYFNNLLGDCTVAALCHLMMMKALVSSSGVKRAFYRMGFVPIRPKKARQWYWSCGIASGGTPPHPDNGLYMADLLKWAFDHKIIEAYAEVDANPANIINGTTAEQRIRQAAKLFYGACLSVELTSDGHGSDVNGNQTTMGQPWSIPPGDAPDPNFGHEVVFSGAFKNIDENLTWGQRQLMTMDWVKQSTYECWVVLTRQDAERTGIDFEKLVAAIKNQPGAVT